MPRELTTEYAAIDDLKPYPGNARRGALSTIAKSLQANGQYRPIVVRRKTREILAGNHLWRAANDLGWSSISVTWVDCDAETARRIVLADNRTADLGTYDDEALADLLSELSDFEGTGYDAADLDELLADLGRSDEPAGPDDPPPLPARPRTKPGDRYLMGPHRLVCADAHSPGAYEALLEGKPAALLWTDPPYGVDYEGKTKARLRIENDGAAGLADLLQGI